jgi:Flp pilus assembly protein TadG
VKTRQFGSTAVEFALVLIIFLTFFLGILDFARMLWTWNAASEATRWGARISVVCDRGVASKAFVLSRMQKFLPQLTSANLVVEWYDAADAISATCNSTNCSGVSVRITGLNYQWLSPIGFSNHAAIPMPGFSTYLPREIMGQDANSSAVCS